MPGTLPGIVTFARAELNAPPAGPRALAELAPGAPAPILLEEVVGQPNAVALEAVLGGRQRGGRQGLCPHRRVIRAAVRTALGMNIGPGCSLLLKSVADVAALPCCEPLRSIRFPLNASLSGGLHIQSV